MLNIDSLENGIVIDHLAAGSGMQSYKLLHLDQLDCCGAGIQNAKSTKYGRKDIIKIDGIIDLDLDILGYVDHNVTVDVIQNGRIAEKKKLVLPKRLKNVIRCKNPRCITSAEPGIDQIFRLCGEDNRSYRCIYCEQKYK